MWLWLWSSEELKLHWAFYFPGPWWESEPGGCYHLEVVRHLGTQQGHVTSVWGQRQAGGLSWWCTGFTQKAIAETVVKMFLRSTEVFRDAMCCLCVLLLEMPYLGMPWQTWQTISLTKQETRLNTIVFTNISTCKSLIYVRSLDSSIYKHMWKYFCLNCNFICCRSLTLLGFWTLCVSGALYEWGVDTGIVLWTQLK